MSESERRLREEDRLRRVAVTAASKQPQEAPDDAEDDSARTKRMEHRTLWVEHQIRMAMARGDFDDLPGAGRPLPGFGEQYDEDWWLKDLIRRENITGVLPGTLALSRQVGDLAETAGTKRSESAVRALVGELNRRIVLAHRGLLDGPPVALRTIDVEQVVRDWRERQRPTRR